MSSTLVLMSATDHPAVDAALAGRVRTAVGADEIRWLSRGVACDMRLPLNSAAPDEAEAAAREAIAGRPVDIAILPEATRRKALLIADMDSTIIGQECIDELADLVGLKSHIAAITERAMRGEIAFEPALRERVALLGGIDLDQIRRVLEERITLTAGARTLVATMRSTGAYTALVSGGFTLFTEAIARRVGFDENRANELLLDGDRLSGLVREPILGRDAKREALAELVAKLGIDAQAAIAVGDGANDLAMLEAAGLGVAFHAKPAVAKAADVRIDHSDLTALLFLQGYSDSEIIAG
ncbi:phosphoserine phosphatase [Tepidamorphus gemmatus]|jgi:phosphoserine phosphatase|uniref:Phosphoserine phosphatase n=1 Tax=Tepidamorphus gemmatus TaxID=747076 RepID=A0A4R3M7S8_9HYPH|nr:phosphoserine phosphatase SerB [Tepidamorphus gemmatus]TCT08339.1 phosphoserine phosphatase [Tepidamorphus gemmatus]